jgi:hypothetical protein
MLCHTRPCRTERQTDRPTQDHAGQTCRAEQSSANCSIPDFLGQGVGGIQRPAAQRLIDDARQLPIAGTCGARSRAAASRRSAPTARGILPHDQQVTAPSPPQKKNAGIVRDWQALRRIRKGPNFTMNPSFLRAPKAWVAADSGPGHEAWDGKAAASSLRQIRHRNGTDAGARNHELRQNHKRTAGTKQGIYLGHISGNGDPMNGCQVGTECCILHAE